MIIIMNITLPKKNFGQKNKKLYTENRKRPLLDGKDERKYPLFSQKMDDFMEKLKLAEGKNKKKKIIWEFGFDVGEVVITADS